MANVNIDDLNELTAPAPGDKLEIIDISEPVAANKNKWTSVENLLSLAGEFSIQFVIGDGANAITTSPAVRGFIQIPIDCTITGWTLVANQVGSIVLDIWKDTYANFPPTNDDSIAGTEKPTLSSAQANQDLDLTTWTVECAAGDWIAIEIESTATVKQVTLALLLVKS